jgi:hypothetical protein
MITKINGKENGGYFYFFMCYIYSWLCMQRSPVLESKEPKPLFFVTGQAMYRKKDYTFSTL